MAEYDCISSPNARRDLRTAHNAAGPRSRRLPTSLGRRPRRTVAHGYWVRRLSRVQSARWLRKQRGPLRDRDVDAGAALQSGAQTAPPSSVSGAAPWHLLLQRVGASASVHQARRPPSRREFRLRVVLTAVLDPSATFPAVLRAWSGVVFAGLPLRAGLRWSVGFWAERRQNRWLCALARPVLPRHPCHPISHSGRGASARETSGRPACNRTCVCVR